jgi:perosamine synthetase
MRSSLELSSEYVHQITKAINHLPGYTPGAATPLHIPSISKEDIASVSDAVESSWVSTAGPYGKILENQITEYCGVEFCVATNSGTSALHLAVLTSGASSETAVITSPLTFVSTANAIKYSGATPIFVDVDLDDFCLSPSSLREYLSTCKRSRSGELKDPLTQKTIKSVLSVNLLGNIYKYQEILDICEEFTLDLIEDSAEALGSFSSEGAHAGTFGKSGVLSFNGNKIVTTGAGGALITNDPKVAAEARHLASQSRISSTTSLSHDRVGFNYLMPSLNASLGIGQVKRIKETLEAKSKVTATLRKAFTESELRFFEPSSRSNNWLNAVAINQPDIEVLNQVISGLNESRIAVRPLWEPMNELSYLHLQGQVPTPNAKALRNSVICLPSSPYLSERK